MLAVVHKRGILSLRELNAAHLLYHALLMQECTSQGKGVGVVIFNKLLYIYTDLKT